jgi:hypothetical protein
VVRAIALIKQYRKNGQMGDLEEVLEKVKNTLGCLLKGG